jgi:signal transduction histidine kinase/ActR/RegA family two-component response regulator
MDEGERREQGVPKHWQAERRLLDDPDDLADLSVPAMRELIHELRQRQMELQGQNDVLRRACQEAKAERDRLTEGRRLEERSRQSQKMEALGTLAGGIAHDFNNILAIIMGYTQVALSRHEQREPVQDYLQEVLAASQRGKDLVQQILMFSRQHSAERSILQLHTVVQETLALLRASLPTTIDIHARINTVSDAVLANLTQLQQVIMSLCSNAEYAMRVRGGILELTLDPVDITPDGVANYPGLKPGAYVRLAVRDTGPGIPPEYLPRIFEPFFTTKEVDEGTGMGLAVAHGIVSSHDGAITVNSRLGEGATFAIYLPQQTPCLSEPVLAAPRLASGQGRILLVDDEADLASAAGLLLDDLGYEVRVYSNALEALALFRAEADTFDLVITDQTMPELTGRALAEAVRAIRPDIPIILCTGYSHVIHAAQAEALGIDAFLMKPVDIDALAETIERVLSRVRADRA